MTNLDQDMINYNKVKDIVLNKLVNEGLLDKSDAEEFSDRCQVLVYKGKWFSDWFKKNVKISNKDANEESYYIRMVEMKDKEDDVDKLLRRTTSSYDE
jgi:hypothetical protein